LSGRVKQTDPKQIKSAIKDERNTDELTRKEM
jgi:hypothetical protein